ncbi:MAG: hypothetical protein CM1200mP26_26980 [Acidimicrobiales bacterium]|nr:MAG: hypothetical protein CM1200mP26_26980 [Acidimicrobiales bacterium]
MSRPADLPGDPRPLGADRRWRDGSEDAVIGILRGATDRSSASDELAAHISDWPTRYHFGRARTNLLQPLDLTGGLRVLDVGAGTGVMSRFAAEQGASVVAVEGDARRAEAAMLRCTDLNLDLGRNVDVQHGSVDVRHGSLDDIDASDGPFDVVLCSASWNTPGTIQPASSSDWPEISLPAACWYWLSRTASG